MTVNEPMSFMPLDLDTFSGSERFMTGTRLGAAFGQGIRAYLRADYSNAIEHFKAALIAAYIEGEERAQIYDRERAIIYLYIGNALAFQEDWEAALREYLEAVQTDPQLSEAHYNLGVAFAARGQIDRAIAAFKEALEHNSRLYEAHFSLGRCYQRLDDAGRAYIHYDQACNARPQAAEPRYYMGLMHQSHGAYELAQRCFTEALRVEPTFISPEIQDELIHRSEEEVALWYYRLSHDLKQQGYAEEAERIYRALLQWRPQEHGARYLLGNLLARSRRLDQAMEVYREIPPQDKHYVESRIRMSAVFKIEGKIKEAYAVLFECAKLHPADGRLFVNMGKLLYDMGKHQGAARAFERAVQLLPQDPQAHYLLGFIYNTLGREGWALAAWRKAVDLAPDAHSLRYDLGYMYIRRGRFDLASKEFAYVLNEWPDDIETSFMLGLCYKELMEPARAIPLFEKVLRRNPRHTQALYYLGASYLQIGNASLGKAYLRRYDYLVSQEQQAVRRSARLPPQRGRCGCRRVRPTEKGVRMERVLVNIPSNPVFERVVRASADEVGQAIGLTPDRIEDLKLAVSEAVNNAIEHGNRLQTGKLVEVVFRLDSEKLEVSIRDEGPGVDQIDFSRRVVEEHNLETGMHRGFGMYLISALVDHCEVSSSHQGTTMTLRLYRKEQDHE